MYCNNSKYSNAPNILICDKNKCDENISVLDTPFCESDTNFDCPEGYYYDSWSPIAGSCPDNEQAEYKICLKMSAGGHLTDPHWNPVSEQNISEQIKCCSDSENIDYNYCGDYNPNCITGSVCKNVLGNNYCSKDNIFTDGNCRKVCDVKKANIPYGCQTGYIEYCKDDNISNPDCLYLLRDVNMSENPNPEFVQNLNKNIQDKCESNFTEECVYACAFSNMNGYEECSQKSEEYCKIESNLITDPCKWWLKYEIENERIGPNELKELVLNYCSYEDNILKPECTSTGTYNPGYCWENTGACNEIMTEWCKTHQDNADFCPCFLPQTTYDSIKTNATDLQIPSVPTYKSCLYGKCNNSKWRKHNNTEKCLESNCIHSVSISSLGTTDVKRSCGNNCDNCEDGYKCENNTCKKEESNFGSIITVLTVVGVIAAVLWKLSKTKQNITNR